MKRIQVSKNGLILTLVSLAIAASVLATPNTVTIIPSSSSHASKPSSKIKTYDKLDKWIDELAALECKNCGAHYRRIDSNGLFSYSCLQFQEGTFVAYGNALGIHGDIYDCAVQKRLARAMILSNYGNWHHWYTSVIVRGLGLPPKKDGDISLLEAHELALR